MNSDGLPFVVRDTARQRTQVGMNQAALANRILGLEYQYVSGQGTGVSDAFVIVRWEVNWMRFVR